MNDFKFKLGEIVLIDPTREGQRRAQRGRVTSLILGEDASRSYTISIPSLASACVVRHQFMEDELAALGEGAEE